MIFNGLKANNADNTKCVDIVGRRESSIFFVTHSEHPISTRKKRYYIISLASVKLENTIGSWHPIDALQYPKPAPLKFDEYNVGECILGLLVKGLIGLSGLW